jgi:hypothetical protein
MYSSLNAEIAGVKTWYGWTFGYSYLMASIFRAMDMHRLMYFQSIALVFI